MSFRIGSGVDFHQLVAGRDLWIGGIKISHPNSIHHYKMFFFPAYNHRKPFFVSQVAAQKENI